MNRTLPLIRIRNISVVIILGLISALVSMQFGITASMLLVVIFFAFIITINHLRGNKILFKLWIFFIGFPFFLSIGGPGLIGPGSSVFNNHEGQTVPFSFFMMLWIAALALLMHLVTRKKLQATKLTKQYFALIFICCVIAIFGTFTDYRFSNINYIFQMLMPFMAYFIMTNYITSRDMYISSIKTFLFGGIVGILLLVISNVLQSGIAVLYNNASIQDKVFFFYVYQIYDYYPVVVAIIATLLISWISSRDTRRNRFLLVCVFLLCILVLTKLNARNAFLMFVTANGLMLMFSRLSVVAKMFLLAACAGIIGFLYNLNLPVFDRFQQDVSSISIRTERLHEGLNQIYNHPFLGSMFRSELITGYHNQYLELAGNAGLIITVLFFCLVLAFLHRAIKFTRSTQDAQVKALSKTIVCIVVAVLIASNIAQSNFTQPLTGFLIWFLIGCQDAVMRLETTEDTLPQMDVRTSLTRRRISEQQLYEASKQNAQVQEMN